MDDELRPEYDLQLLLKDAARGKYAQQYKVMKGDVMEWNDTQQLRFDDLRKRELSGALTAEEQVELVEIVATLEQEEARYLVPAAARMEAEQAVLREQLQEMQDDNEELAMLFHQQEQLVMDARRWLADFRQRHERIQTAYTRLTSDTFLAA